MKDVLDRIGVVHEFGSMITTTHSHGCRQCGSLNIVKNGHNRSGSQQYLCKDCRTVGVLTPQPPRYSPDRREEILTAYHERPSMRGIRRVFGGSRNPLSAWRKKSPAPAIAEGDADTCDPRGCAGTR